MNKLTISNLILLIINKENTSILRNEALKELKKRSYEYGLDYNYFINFDEENINKRGFQTADYLFSRATDMQKLMDTYFSNIYTNDNKLLLSEMHLCNNFGHFFDIITLKEMKNILKRLKDKNISISEKQRLLKVMEILKDRYNTKGKHFFSNDDVYLILNYFKYDFSCEEMLSQKSLSNNELMRRTMLGSLINNEYIKYLHLSSIIKKEERKLKEQKRTLLTQVKNGYNVNYHSEDIDKIIIRRIKK